MKMGNASYHYNQIDTSVNKGGQYLSLLKCIYLEIDLCSAV